MTTQTEAMKLALEALNTTESDCGSRAWEREQEAITALREALAEQPAQQEPMSFDRLSRGMEILAWNRAQAKPPIEISKEQWVADELERFYTTPQAQPLTDDKYEAIVEDIADWNRYVEVDTAHQSLEKHVREVLTAHGITKGNT